MHSAPRNERDIEVNVSKTVAFDVELHLGEGVPAPSRMGDKENGSDMLELEKEEEDNSGLVERDLEVEDFGGDTIV